MAESLPLAPSKGDLRAPLGLPIPAWVAIVSAVLSIFVITSLTVRAQQGRQEAAESLAHTLEVIEQLQGVVSTIKDAETGQRGFLLTASEAYLAPYTTAKSALGPRFLALRQSLGTDPRQSNRLGQVERTIADKFEEMQQTVDLGRAGKLQEALAIVRTDRGKQLMDVVRDQFASIEAAERASFQSRRETWAEEVANSQLVTFGGAAMLLLLTAIAAVVTSQVYRRREVENWLREGQVALSTRLQGDLRLDQLGESALRFLAEYTRAPVGAFYVAESDGSFLRVASHAAEGSSRQAVPRIEPGDGLLGQVGQSARTLVVRDVPAGHLDVTSSLGRSAPRELLLMPAAVHGKVQAVVELGFFRKVTGIDEDLMARVSEAIAMSMRAARDRSRLEELLEETQRQSEELQSQQEELRVSNEELEEQGRVLQESQTRLENQQAELEQNNSQLSEQSRILETQKDELEQAHAALGERAAALERASQYKSEFLANMSHELRTPLNSTLILAKLLADNAKGNLSDEQVKFAETIGSAGNDLLLLINDILDLAKVEAGKIDIDPQPMEMPRLLANIARVFEPQARQRKIELNFATAPDVPASIVTDETRLGQVLRNLLSNALKFTPAGSVSLHVTSDAARQSIDIAVRDTGIGIDAAHLQTIFEPFTQADGSTQRRFGGTGLGLAISRDLARLLGGAIVVESTPGHGSTFTLTLPWTLHKPTDAQVAFSASTGLIESFGTAMSHSPAAVHVGTQAPTPAGQLPAGSMEDDRDALSPGRRCILVIEDDVNFAAILRSVVREANYACVIASTASEGLHAASSLRPDAILLDMNLPDHSGLSVLDQLKRNPKTRHIPVHICSVDDHAHDALEMGAIGYAFKPVDRDQLKQALRRMEDKFSQVLRRVLVVEDDVRQRESVSALLAADGVEIVGAPDAGAALDALKSQTFDCMVMDLSLPDMSGFELLEKMAQQEGVSFPPVIVYTGRNLSPEDEAALRRFSRSIIIKGARSPERLLDEVSLFLHQVETDLPPARQKMLRDARGREATLDGRRVLVVEDDVRNIYALSAVLEPKGASIELARNGLEALAALDKSLKPGGTPIDLVLMDIMMPEMDGYTAMREIRKQPQFAKLPIIALTAKAMKDDQEKCLSAGANDYIAKPLDVEKLLSLIRVWIRK